jgi:hypothetical protein
MSKFGKIRNISGKTSTHRAENIFPKYLLYNVHEIARKYPREKKRYSKPFQPCVWFLWTLASRGTLLLACVHVEISMYTPISLCILHLNPCVYCDLYPRRTAAARGEGGCWPVVAFCGCMVFPPLAAWGSDVKITGSHAAGEGGGSASLNIYIYIYIQNMKNSDLSPHLLTPLSTFGAARQAGSGRGGTFMPLVDYVLDCCL